MEPIFIIAGAYEQYCDFVARHRLDRSKVRYLHGSRQLCGLRRPVVVFVGTTPMHWRLVDQELQEVGAVEWTEAQLLDAMTDSVHVRFDSDKLILQNRVLRPHGEPFVVLTDSND